MAGAETKMLSNLNLGGLEIRGACAENLSSAPSSPAGGQIYFDTTSHKCFIWNGTVWLDATVVSTLTTKGDLLAYSTSVTRLGVGTDGYLLTADSTAATGISWKYKVANTNDPNTIPIRDGSSVINAKINAATSTITTLTTTTINLTGSYNNSIPYISSGSLITSNPYFIYDGSHFGINCDNGPKGEFHVSSYGGTTAISEGWTDSAFPTFQLRRTGGNPGMGAAAVTNSAAIGALTYSGSSTATIYTVGAQIIGYVDGTVSSGVLPTRLEFQTGNGTNVTRLIIGSTGIITGNSTNASTGDFNWMGQTDANLLFVDVSADKIGIGKNNPSYKLDVTGDIGVSSKIYWANVNLYQADTTTLKTDTALSAGTAVIAGTRIVSGIASATTSGTAVSIDAATCNQVYISASAAFTVNIPTNGVDAQKLLIKIKNTSAGTITPTLTTTGTDAFRFGSDLTALSDVAAGKTDYIGCIYNGTDSRWDVIAYAKGY